MSAPTLPSTLFAPDDVGLKSATLQIATPRTERGLNQDEDTVSVEASPPPAIDGQPLVAFKRNTKNFGVLPIPRRLQYHPDEPFPFSLWAIFGFSAAATVFVCSLAWNTPLLNQLADAFEVDNTRVANLPTLTQAGYGTGILLITPLGDLVPRRPLLFAVILCSLFFTVVIALNPSFEAFMALCFLLGVVTISPQILTPLAVDMAPETKRNTVISIMSSGLALGSLLGRVLSGLVAQYSSSGLDGWRNVYWMAAGLQGVNALLLWATVPDWPAKNQGTGLTYFGVLKTMGKLVVTEPVLVQCCLTGINNSTILSSFWVQATFILGAEPFNYSTFEIGLFALVGAFGVCMGPFVGRFMDRLNNPWLASLIAIGLIACFEAVMVGAGGVHIAATVIAILGEHFISFSSRVYSIDPTVRARLNAVLIVSLFCGQVMGTQAGTRMYEAHGWRASTALSYVFIAVMLAVLLSRGPWCPRKRWFGGWSPVSKSPVAKKADVENQAAASSTEEVKSTN
ncbi:MFS general substrate transporter [Auriculariales sp. MPI-PUGE-AT-0066]|nr:MFS general substrate transporter [Auriculariales sp. MPI-PUGE-AT-0066]